MPPTSISRPMPVRSAADALFLLGLAAQEPLAPATYTFFLDRDGVGGVITEVSGGSAPDTVLDIVGIMAGAAASVEHAEYLVVATMRPDGTMLPGDADRWSTASEICSAHGVGLLEWFIISPQGVAFPRSLIGEPERWAFTRRHDVAPG